MATSNQTTYHEKLKSLAQAKRRQYFRLLTAYICAPLFPLGVLMEEQSIKAELRRIGHKINKVRRATARRNCWLTNNLEHPFHPANSEKKL